MGEKLKKFLSHSLYSYDKAKMNILKALLPFVIIIHHVSNLGFRELAPIGKYGDAVMYIFFAMSGYGLVISYKQKKDLYINGFLKRSLPKLFVPYFITLFIFVIYRCFEGVDQIELLKANGLLSFVPTSWYIYILSLFYICFFLAFRYVKKNVTTKVLLTCFLVVAYCLVAPHVGIEYWRYLRCPAFCVGMVFALCDDFVRMKFVRWHAILTLVFLLILKKMPGSHFVDFFYYPAILFLFMYVISSMRELKFVNFLSSISLEMFIIQFIPIYIVLNDFAVTNTKIVVFLILILDVVFALFVHTIVLRINRLIKRKS